MKRKLAARAGGGEKEMEAGAVGARTAAGRWNAAAWAREGRRERKGEGVPVTLARPAAVWH